MVNRDSVIKKKNGLIAHTLCRNTRHAKNVYGTNMSISLMYLIYISEVNDELFNYDISEVMKKKIFLNVSYTVMGWIRMTLWKNFCYKNNITAFEFQNFSKFVNNFPVDNQNTFLKQFSSADL